MLADGETEDGCAGGELEAVAISGGKGDKTSALVITGSQRPRIPFSSSSFFFFFLNY